MKTAISGMVMFVISLVKIERANLQFNVAIIHIEFENLQAEPAVVQSNLAIV